MSAGGARTEPAVIVTAAWLTKGKSRACAERLENGGGPAQQPPPRTKREDHNVTPQWCGTEPRHAAVKGPPRCSRAHRGFNRPDQFPKWYEFAYQRLCGPMLFGSTSPQYADDQTKRDPKFAFVNPDKLPLLRA